MWPRRQPDLIFAAIAKIENPSVREKMLASYEAHLTTLSELFNRYDGAERLQAALESDRSPQLEINWYQYLQQKWSVNKVAGLIKHKTSN